MTLFRRFTEVFRRLVGPKKPASLLSPIPTGGSGPINNAPTTPYLGPAMAISKPRGLNAVEGTDPFATEATLSDESATVPVALRMPPEATGTATMTATTTSTSTGTASGTATAPAPGPAPAPPRARAATPAPPAPPHDPLAEYDVRLKQGPAAGLWFNPGATSLSSALATGDLPLQRALDVVVREGMNVLDAGAGFGQCTLVAARRCAGGQVFAFEPLGDTAALLERSCFLNGFQHVEVHRVALADRDGEARMLLSRKPGHSRLDLAGMPLDPAGAVPVPVATLDSIVSASVCPAPDVLVLDVQGGEAAVLRGGAGVLRAGRPIVLARVHSTGPAIAKLLEPLGYETFALGAGEMATPITPQHRWVVAFARERHHLKLYLPALSHRSLVEQGRML